MSKAKRKRLIASLLMLSLGSCPALATTVPIDAAVPNSVGAYIYVDKNSNVNKFTVGRVEGWTGTNQGAVVNYYSGNNLILNAADDAVQEYVNNKAGDDVGGAIYNSQLVNPKAKVVINGDSYFSGNTANRAGAIYNDGGFEFNGNVTFDNNIATGAARAPGGGAILNADGAVSFQEGSTVIFSNNKATGDGGAILNVTTLADRTNSFDLTKVDSVTFSNNNATGNGGAIANIKGQTGSNPAEIKIANATFSNNRATANGGAIALMGGNVTVLETGKVSFDNNTAQFGGAILASGSDSVLSLGNSASFTNNISTGDVNKSAGGAISARDNAKVTIGDDAYFSGNKADNQGGAIHNQASNVTIGNNARFIGNQANLGDTNSSGGAIYMDVDNGNGANITSVSTTIGSGAHFENNSGRGAGAIYGYEAGSADVTSLTLEIGDKATFLNNHATAGNGGAVGLYGGELEIGKEAEFAGNTATGSGGALYIADYNGHGLEAIIKGNTTFTNNSAETGTGGAIYNDGTLTLNTDDGNITFTGNTTGTDKVLNDINTDGTVNITGDKNTVSVNTITGSEDGEINKTGGNTLALNDNNSGFKGDFTQSAGVTEVLKEFFGGTSTIKNSSVDMKNGSSIVAGSEVTLNENGVMNIEEGANINIAGTVTGSDATGVVKNSGNINISGTLNADIKQTDKGSITVNDGATLGTKSDENSAIVAGALTIRKGAIIDGIVEVTEAVSLDIGGRQVVFDDTGLKIDSNSGTGYITNEGTFNLGNANIGVEDSGLNDSITLSNGSYLSPVTEGATVINLGDRTTGEGENPTITYSSDAVTNEEHTLNVREDATLKLAPTNGNNFVLNSDVTSAEGEGNVLVDQIKVKNPNYVDEATTPDEEKFIEQGVGTVTINSDNSGFKGNFLQNMGNVILAAKAKFFGGQNKIDGGSLTVQKEATLTAADDNATQVTGGSLNLQDGAILDKNVTVTTDDNSYGTVNLYNAIKGEVGEDGVSRIDADSIANGNDGTLTYDGSEKTISITNGAGLGLFNGVRVEGDSLALQQDKGVRDLTFGNGSGSETNSIVLNENTKLTYRDGAYIKDDSTVDMKDGASLNFANNTTDVTYNPIISGTENSTINKTGNGSTVIASALDKFTGNVNVLGGALELATAEDKTFNNLNVQNADFHSVSNIGVEGAEGNGKVNIENSNFSVDKTLEAMAEVNIDGSNVNIAENLGGADTTITDSTVNVGKEMSTNDLNVTNSTLNVASNLYSDNTVLDAVNATIGGNLDAENLTAQNGTNLTVAGDVSAADSAFTDSTVNLNGKNSSFNSLIVNGSTLNNMTNMTVANDLIFGAGANGTNSTLNMTNGTVNTITANNTVLNGDLNIAFDVDPSKGYAIDSIKTNTYTDNGNQLIVGGINFVSSPIDRNFSVDASNFINSGDGNVASFGETSFIANTHIGKYLMSTGAGGGSVISGSLQSINPQMYRGQVATVASYMNQLVVNNMLFDHMEVITRQMMAQERTANKYAATEPLFAPYQYSGKDGTLWYKAYANFERLSMNQGLSVGNNAYGSLIGADFPLIELGNGWKIIPTAYVGYNGAHQTFNGVSMYQNGGQIGAMGTAYKGDFLTSLLVYGGGYANDMNVNNASFGSASDTTGNWFAGVASKTAYNFHLAKDFIFQPTALVSYNMFGNQNWHSNFGAMGMNAGFMNGINIAPGMNLIWQKKTWSLYATVQYMYNIMGGVDGRAGNVTLDGVRMRHGYLEYGIGATKTFKDRLTSYLQITIRNVGRTGIGFQFGLNWKI